MNSPRELGGRLLLSILALLFLTVLVLALISLINDWRQTESDEQIPEPAGPHTTVSQTTVPVFFNDTDLGTLGCYRAASGPMAGSFVVELTMTNGNPEEITVGIDLEGPEENRQQRAVTLTAVPDQAVITVIVPVSNGSVPFETCTVTAIQQGQQVILTGN